MNDTEPVKEIINETIYGSRINQQTINIFEQVLGGNDLTNNPLLDLTPQLQSSLIEGKAPEASSGVGNHSIIEFAEYDAERRHWREDVDKTDHRHNAFSEIREQVSDASTDFEPDSIIQNNERLKRPKPLSLIFNEIDEKLDGTRCTWFDHTPFVDQHAKMPKHPNCQEDLFFTMNNYIRDPHPEQGCPYDIHDNDGQTTTIVDVDKKLINKDKLKGFCLADLVKKYPHEANDHHSAQSEETIINFNDDVSPPSLVEVDDNYKSKLDITMNQAIPDELNPAHHIKYHKGQKVIREQHATPNVVISQIPAQPATQFMQKEYCCELQHFAFML